jgi:hypothetical protein
MKIIRRRGDRIQPDQLDAMCYWVEEREKVRARRENNDPKPWSQDSLFTAYRWCNVRRMDDRVSHWLLRWHQTHPEIGLQNRMVAAVGGRLINWPPSLQALPYPAPYDEYQWTMVLLKRKARREKVFTGAYIINGALGGDKILQVTRKVLAPLWAARRTAPKHPQTMREVWDWLNGKPGIGSFMAGQAVADLRHIHHELPWSDRLSWAPQGPGSKRGVNRLVGQPPGAGMPYNEWLDVLRLAHARGAARLPHIYDRLELMDTQNVMCEYDKYQRLKNGEGSVRSRYREFAGWN